MARQGPYSGTFAIYHTFHTTETSAADGTAISCAGLAGVGVQLEGIVGETITFEGTIDGSTWYAVQTVNRNDGSVGTTATADGLYFADVAGTDQFRARISTADSGSVTATGYGVTITGGIVADIDIVGQEDVNVAQMNGVATTMGAGNAGTGVQRVAVATDDINLAAINAVSGTTSGAAVVTDANGTLQQYLRGLVKLIVAQITVDVDDISGGTQTNDVKVTLDSETVVLGAGEAHTGEVHANSIQVDVTPTITAGAYTVGDVIGAIQTIANAARVSGKQTTLDTLVITDLAMQDADIKIWFFNANPSNGTYTDNGALDIHDTDLGFAIGVVRVLSSDYDDATDNSVATLRNIGLKLTPAATSLFAIAEIETADTYGTTGDLTFKYSWSRD